MVQILNVCSALHNICLIYKVPTVEEEAVEHPTSNAESYADIVVSNFSNIAKSIRDAIKNNMQRS